ncbi:Hypothetical_protein [Hexamita inflata]|uniref:Hypothetical_protein n=1 Tax=Hexamita inflata TaxID=28002 RepID=A0ABP1GI72_9EUKA
MLQEFQSLTNVGAKISKRGVIIHISVNDQNMVQSSLSKFVQLKSDLNWERKYHNSALYPVMYLQISLNYVKIIKILLLRFVQMSKYLHWLLCNIVCRMHLMFNSTSENMHRNHSKLALTAQPVLDTIQEDDHEFQEHELESTQQLTRENSYENCQMQIELENAIEARNLIRLTSFEIQTIKRRVNQLLTDMSVLSQRINIIQESQVAIIDIIVGSTDM